jgi:hypothetical protein
MADIFVSYAQRDVRRVQPLVTALEKQRWSVFWDRKIPYGQDWASHIGRAIDEAGCVLVVWSARSVKSSAVIEEAGVGKRRGRLVPVRLDPVEPPLGHGFRDIQFADLVGQRLDRPSAPLRRLLKDIGEILRATPAERAGERVAGASERVRRAAGRARRPRARSAPGPMVRVGEVRLPKADPRAHEFWDGSTGPREIAVPVAFDVAFSRSPSVVVGLREFDLGDPKAGIHRLSVRAENVRPGGFDLYFATWHESQVYGAVASWVAVSN